MRIVDAVFWKGGDAPDLTKPGKSMAISGEFSWPLMQLWSAGADRLRYEWLTRLCVA